MNADANRLAIYFSKGYIYIGLMSCHNTIEDSDLETVLNVNQSKIRTSIRNSVNSDDCDEICEAFEELCKLRTMRVKWTWITQILEDNKSKFIKNFLKMIKLDQIFHVQLELNDAKRAHIDWKELEIIRNGIT